MEAEEQIYSADQIKVHIDLAHTLKEYSKCVILEDPNDILEFSYLYFKRKVEKNENIKPESDQFLMGLSKGTAKTNKKIINDDLNTDTFMKQKENIFSNDLTRQVESTEFFRKLLTETSPIPKIQKVIDNGIVERCIQFLDQNDSDDTTELKFKAAWVITNVASADSNQTEYVVEAGAVPIFIKLLMSPNEDIREQSIWALGNIAGDNNRLRDFVLKHSGLTSLIKSFDKYNDCKTSTIINATWYLSNLCRNKPSLETVCEALPFLAKYLKSDDEETISNVCWSLSYIAEISNQGIQAVLDSEVVARMIELLNHSNSSIQSAALRTIGNIISGDDSQTQTMIDLNPLPSLLKMLDNSTKDRLKKEVCWTISNITAGTPNQIQTVIDAGVFPKIMEILKSSSFDIKKEAYWVISNVTAGGNDEQIAHLIKQGAVSVLCTGLSEYVNPENKIVTVCLEGLANLLRYGERYNDFYNLESIRKMVSDGGGIKSLMELQSHESYRIYSNATNIIERYFQFDNEITERLDNSLTNYLNEWKSNPPNLSADEKDGIELLLQEPQLDTLRYLVQSDPSKISKILDIIGKNDPHLLDDIHNNNDDFMALLNNTNGIDKEKMQKMQLDIDIQNKKLYPDSINHECHIHPLIKMSNIYDGRTYYCNICETTGSEWVYHCAQCQFDAHPKCANSNDDTEDKNNNDDNSQIQKVRRYRVIYSGVLNIRKSIKSNSKIVSQLNFGDFVDIVKEVIIRENFSIIVRGKLLNGQGWTTISYDKNCYKGELKIFFILPDYFIEKMSVKNHPHILQVNNDVRSWNCDGRKNDCSCMAKVMVPNRDTRALIRYRCTEGCDFDYCEWCMSTHRSDNYPILKKYRVINNDGGNVRESINLDSEIVKVIPQGEIIDVDEVDGCHFQGNNYLRAKLVDNSGWVTLHVQDYRDQIIATICLPHFPLQDIIEVINHPHKLQMKPVMGSTSWTCDGKNLKGGCVAGGNTIHTDGWRIRYHCETCDHNYCEWCAYAYAEKSYKNMTI